MTEDLYELRSVSPGYTRHCLWPWNHVEVHTDGGVALCCVRPPIGNLRDSSFNALRSGPEARSLRASLLSGELDELCSRCLLAPLVPVSELAQSVQQLLQPPKAEPEPELPTQALTLIGRRNRLAEIAAWLPGLRYVRLAKQLTLSALGRR